MVGDIVLAGDSSGAGLVMSLLLSLPDEGLPIPGGAVLLCPGVDLTGAHLDPDGAADLAGHVRRSRELYLDGHPVEDPVVSPLLADLTGLPPLLVQSATGDAARGEARLLVERARAHGVDARLELYAAHHGGPGRLARCRALGLGRDAASAARCRGTRSRGRRRFSS